MRTTREFNPRITNPPISLTRTSWKISTSWKKSFVSQITLRSNKTASWRGILDIHQSFSKDPFLRAYTTFRSRSFNLSKTTKISLIHLQQESVSVPMTMHTPFRSVVRVVSVTVVLMATWLKIKKENSLVLNSSKEIWSGLS